MLQRTTVCAAISPADNGQGICAVKVCKTEILLPVMCLGFDAQLFIEIDDGSALVVCTCDSSLLHKSVIHMDIFSRP